MALSKKGSPGQVWEFKKVSNEEYCIFRLQNGKKQIVQGDDYRWNCWIVQYKEEQKYEDRAWFRWVIEKRGEDEKGQHLYSIKNVDCEYRMNYHDDGNVCLSDLNHSNEKWRQTVQQW